MILWILSFPGMSVSFGVMVVVGGWLVRGKE